MVGKLNWLGNCTRYDIAFAVNALCRHFEKPSENHWKAAKRVCRYLNGTPNESLHYPCSNVIELRGYVDADYAGDSVGRKSTTGYIFMVNRSPVVWRSGLQDTVAMSSAEAEYIAMCEASLEAVFLRKLLRDFGEKVNEPTVICADNQSAIKMAKNPMFHRRTKHIDVKYNKVRELVENQSVKFEWVESNENLADMLTKPLGPQNHFCLLEKIKGLVAKIKREC